MTFVLKAPYNPSGDQPHAIDKITKDLNAGRDHQILLGVTGSGKTYTMSNVIQNVNRPTLVLAHNKTLAAQLCAEFREFFPKNAVEYFVSYYDYYQPEAYVAQRDLYIEKEAEINEEIERLRHSATRALLSRRDVIIVASVSCIYGLGTPSEYKKGIYTVKVGDRIPRRTLLEQLELIQYERNDIELKNGRYRINGNIIDIYPSWEEHVVRLEFFGDELERIDEVHPVTGDNISALTEFDIYPATHYVVLEDMDGPISAIKKEMKSHVKAFKEEGRLVEAQRLEQRTTYDLEMMGEMGYCKGIENYARHLSGKAPGEPPGCLIDFFPEDFLTIIDESHVTIPQVRGMYRGDQARKKSLIDYGFRLPSALDNRPLQFEEFSEKVGQCIYVSATPGPYELDLCKRTLDAQKKDTVSNVWADYDVVEMINRPTGLLDPHVMVRPTKHQVDDLLGEIHQRIDKNERVLVTTVTKQMAEDLADYISEKDIKVRYLHSDIVTLERIDILHELRVGICDVLVGVNLLREGLDLPEVSLVAIMDADKEGFLRHERALIQTMGRAARHANGTVILYGDRMTDSMKGAINETNRRRQIQEDYNNIHGITPKTIIKEIKDIREHDRQEIKAVLSQEADLDPTALPVVIAALEKQMHQAAKELQFEVAAVLRDKIEQLKNQDTIK